MIASNPTTAKVMTLCHENPPPGRETGTTIEPQCRIVSNGTVRRHCLHPCSDLNRMATSRLPLFWSDSDDPIHRAVSVCHVWRTCTDAARRLLTMMDFRASSTART